MIKRFFIILIFITSAYLIKDSHGENYITHLDNSIDIAIRDSVNTVLTDLSELQDSVNIAIDTLYDVSKDTKLLLTNVQVVDDSLSETLHLSVSIDAHNHDPGRGFGMSGDQSGNNWMTEASHTKFIAYSGNGVYGADNDADTTKVIGTDDTPLYTGGGFDMREVLVVAVSVGTLYWMRFIWHTDNAALGVAANQFTELAFLFDTTNPNLAAGIPIETFMPDLVNETKVWAQVSNATDNATVTFVVIIQPELH